jgi:hypothetical protein
VAHSVAKGQQQLKEEKDAEKGITSMVPYKYDEEVSLKKFYLAIVMHEYPFNISKHDFLFSSLNPCVLAFQSDLGLPLEKKL